MPIAWTDANMLAACDNIAATLVDAYSVVTAAQNKVTSVQNDFLAEAIRIHNINDLTVQGTLTAAYLSESQAKATELIHAGRTISLLLGINYGALIEAAPQSILDNLDFLTRQMLTPGTYTGLANWASTQQQTLHVAFADAFNQFVTDVGSGKYVRTYGNQALAPIPLTNNGVFPAVTVDSTQVINVTGLAVATIGAGTAALAPIASGFLTPAGGTLEANAKTAIGVNSYTITCTYTNIWGATGLTGTISVVGAAGINTIFASSFASPVAAITGVVLTNGNAGDQIAIRLKPVRTVVA